MVDTLGAINKVQTLIDDVGRATVHNLYPYDIEYYAISLELTDYDNSTIDLFTFPVMPSSITKSENNRINVKKTYSGVTVINSKSYTPQEISIAGNFGRSFKILINKGEATTFKAFKFSLKNGVRDISDMDEAKVNTTSASFDVAVKSGYGCIKILQSIINKASATDDKGKSFRLYLYNPALGESYLVVPAPNAMTLKQNDSQNNMIWGYQLNLIAIAPVSGTIMQGNNSSNINILTPGFIQKSANTFVSIVSNNLF